MKIIEYDPKTKLSRLAHEEFLLDPIIANFSKEAGKKEPNYLTFVFLMEHEGENNPYREYPLAEKKNYSLQASGLTEADVTKTWVDNFRVHYVELMNSSRILRMIRSMYTGMDKLCVYLDEVDFMEEIQSGSAKGQKQHKPKDFISVVKEAKYLLDTLKDLEKKAKEELAAGEQEFRGNVTMGRQQRKLLVS